MIKKNSGGEGQNPLYVALLASFAQAYRIGLPPKLRRSPTIRLVVLDEAFSKMDAEKVASCIQLIRDLGFQARLAEEQDVKRILAVYYQQDVTTERFDDFDGEGCIKENA